VSGRANVERVRTFYEAITRDSLRDLPALYVDDAYFRDPFNEVRGVEEIRRIFEKMFKDLDDCSFRIADVAGDDAQAFMTWNFTFRVRRFRPDVVQTIHGASHLRFDPDGRVKYHRDYWDAAEELYAKLPVVGGLMRYLKRRMA
jgi:steroid Delta-isomerase